MSSLRFGLTCSLLLFAISLDAGQSCLAPEAIWRMRSISDAQIAPDGKSVVYVMSWNDEIDDTSYSNLWQIATGGGEPRQITAGKYHDNNPRWSPDGTQIAYVTDRDGAGSIHIRSLTSGEDHMVLTGRESVSNL